MYSVFLYDYMLTLSDEVRLETHIAYIFNLIVYTDQAHLEASNINRLANLIKYKIVIKLL